MIYCHNYNHVIPCLHCHPHSYIRMVQHLIERCLLLYMNRQQCVKALAKYASIRPCITITGGKRMQHIIPYMIKFGYLNVLILMHSTVWRELEKENKDFFEAYFQALSLQAFYG
ncbi:hypothetical protein E1A91_D01G185700v1 [Gossypium mustelinum]|uniref:Uncharacterized protein n=1 Tax=Gossypium mustelinum TaxID=34275 RepID=A0A5D2W8I8_GOSMU|nr:hypothetical protein E1A91_D01G185700v1 [Gossypium mustelinum]TYI98062.1 hypothetical protein E1A91_D01G185700v1 [Gossypium mustelinum]